MGPLNFQTNPTPQQLSTNLQNINYNQQFPMVGDSGGNSFWNNLGSTLSSVGSAALGTIGNGALGGLGSLASGVISGIGSLFGIKSSAQKSQEKIAQQQYALGQEQIQAQRDINQANLDEAQKARQWQEDMYGRQLEDYSAEAIKQRYLDAGLNPYIMMGNGNNGAQSSVPGAPAMPQLSAPDGGYNTMSAALGNQFQNRLLAAQEHQASSSGFLSEQEALIKQSKNAAELYHLYKSTDNDTFRRTLEAMMNYSVRSMNDQTILSAIQSREESQARIKQIMADTAGRNLQNHMQKILNEWQPYLSQLGAKQLNEQINNLVAEVALNKAMKKWTDARCLTEISIRAKNFASAALDRNIVNSGYYEKAANAQDKLSGLYDANSQGAQDENQRNRERYDSVESKLQGKVVEAAKAGYEMTIRDNDYYWVNKTIDVGSSLAGAAIGGITAGTGAAGLYYLGQKYNSYGSFMNRMNKDYKTGY